MEGKLHMEVDERVTQEIMPPRRVPLSLKDRLKQELTPLEKEHVIIKEGSNKRLAVKSCCYGET